MRTFPSFSIPENTENLLLGSSLVKNLVNHNSLPQDICIHAYRHIVVQHQKKSKAVPEKYPEKELKTVVLQDGTNSILKQEQRDVNNLFNEYIELVEVVSHKFQPKSLLLMVSHQSSHQIITLLIMNEYLLSTKNLKLMQTLLII